MRVLYIATSFPKPECGATIYTDLAEALHNAGHEIVVAVSEQHKNIKCTKMSIERGFTVLRIVTGDYYDVGLIRKGMSTIINPYLMKKAISKYLKDRKFDMILFESPPVTNCKLVAWSKKIFKCPAYLMLKDIFPQNAVDLQLIRYNSILYRYFRKKEKKLYKIADVIGCMSQGNKEYLLKNNHWIREEKINIFPNTKKIASFSENEITSIRERYGISENACVFLFGGNMGKPQYVDLLCEAILDLKNSIELFFVFVGRGTERYKLESTIKENEIKNALVIENLPREDFDCITMACNVGLIILDPRFTIPNYPSRILSYMEYSKAILAATDDITDFKKLIEEAQCGEWVNSADKKAFKKKILEMSNDKNLKEKGLNGRIYMEKHFSVEYSVKILENYFNKRKEG